MEPKCLAKTMKPINRKRDQPEIGPCTRFAWNNTRFCENHQNLCELTEEQFTTQTKICSGCKKHVYFDDMSYMICPNCRSRCEDNRQTARENKIKCNLNGCPYQSLENGYCGKHQTEYHRLEIIKRGNKCCTNIIRGCPNPELQPDYPFSKCRSCLEKDRVGEIKCGLNKLQDTKALVDTLPVIFAYVQTEQERESLYTIRFDNQHIFDTVYMLHEQPHKVCSYPKHHLLHQLQDFLTEIGKNTYDEWLQTHESTSITLPDIISYMFARRMIRKFCDNITENLKLARNNRLLTATQQSDQIALELRNKWHLENINKYRDYMYRFNEPNNIETEQFDDICAVGVDVLTPDSEPKTDEIPLPKIKLILRPKIHDPVIGSNNRTVTCKRTVTYKRTVTTSINTT